MSKPRKPRNKVINHIKIGDGDAFETVTAASRMVAGEPAAILKCIREEKQLGAKNKTSTTALVLDAREAEVAAEWLTRFAAWAKERA
jgi:hypothetical protein